MKKILLIISSFFTAGICSAQWTPLTSGTLSNLHDIDFLNAGYGAVAGDAGTVLLTTNGGQSWSSINNQLTTDIYSVEIITVDTIVISDYDQSISTGTVYITYNGGLSWTPIGTDATTNHKLDLHASPHVFAIGSNLIGTGNYGTQWDTLANYTGGTTSLNQLTFAGPMIGYASGLVSGIVGYSATFMRTNNGGASWYPCNPFDFSNADALTTMSYINADTAMMFTNHYSGFTPSSQNGLVKLYNFNLTTQFPPDSIVAFTSVVINSAMPAYINDAHFFDSNNGVAAGEDGHIYRTLDGGITWTSEYTSGASLNKMSFPEEGGAYAVGDGGAIIKFDSTTSSIADIANGSSVVLYPNPGKNELTVLTDEWTPGNQLNAVLYNVSGKAVKEFLIDKKHFTCDVSSLSPGVYFLDINNEAGNTSHLKWIKE